MDNGVSNVTNSNPVLIPNMYSEIIYNILKKNKKKKKLTFTGIHAAYEHSEGWIPSKNWGAEDDNLAERLGPHLSVPLPSSREVVISGKSVVIRQMQGQATNMSHDQARLGYPEYQQCPKLFFYVQVTHWTIFTWSDKLLSCVKLTASNDFESHTTYSLQIRESY